MNNPIFNAMMQNTPLGGMQNLIQQYKQFRQTFQGDPQQKIQETLNGLILALHVRFPSVLLTKPPICGKIRANQKKKAGEP